ncbi:MAG: hypothetical protein FJX11_09050 [Alphaproteobacteria bacterium]|nr:hypothetical protein [Alphaproteobacteria bacterium]
MIGSRLLAVAIALPAALCLPGRPAVAQYCDGMEGQDIKATGAIDRMVDAAGVVFFRDRKTACQFGLVLHRNDKGCKVGAQIEVSGKLIKNKFLPDTYDVDRGGRPANETLVCK